MGNFKRDTKSMYSVPQRFADTTFKQCPFCKENEPEWLVRDEWKLLDRDYYFKCPACGSIMKVAQSDVTGLAFTKATMAGQLKSSKGKDNRTVYVVVEKVGLSVRNEKNSSLEGTELSLSELKELAKNEEEAE